MCFLIFRKKIRIRGVTTIADRQLRTGQLRTTIADDNCGRDNCGRQLRTTIADKTIADDKNGLYCNALILIEAEDFNYQHIFSTVEKLTGRSSVDEICFYTKDAEDKKVKKFNLTRNKNFAFFSSAIVVRNCRPQLSRPQLSSAIVVRNCLVRNCRPQLSSAIVASAIADPQLSYRRIRVREKQHGVRETVHLKPAGRGGVAGNAPGNEDGSLGGPRFEDGVPLFFQVRE
uniref:Uncharacterized protein n=1 Tax=Globodera rostochiensis TaxID=31243 RepID=A0A914GUF0_GLORO